MASTATLPPDGGQPQRGRGGTDAIGILPACTGTAGHDAWAPSLTDTTLTDTTLTDPDRHDPDRP